MRSRPRRTRIRGLKAPAALLLLAALMLALTGTAIAKKDSTGSSTTTEETTTEETTSEETTTKKEKTSEETTTEDTTTEETTSEEGTISAQTTTASAELNAQSLQLEPRTVTTNPGGQLKCDPEGEKVDPPTPGGTDFITITDTVATVTNTFTFVWNDAGGGETTAGTWSSTFPFTGQIIVKSQDDQAIQVNGQSTGTITTPSPGQGISHVEVCYEGTGTRTVTVPVTATVNQTVKKKGEVAGKSAAGGAQAAAAVQARPSKDTLPFTGLHAPLLALIGLISAGSGFAIRRRLGSEA